MQYFRSLLFYVCLMPLALFFGSLCLVLWVFPYKIRNCILLGFNWCSLKLLQLCCGVRYRIHGAENIPDVPFVIMAKHQSTWETFFLQLYFSPLSTIMKKELLRIPFFGWGLALLKPIPIDRSNPRAAIKQVKTDGVKRLQEGNNVLVFPEGTRIPFGETGNYARSGADIAIAAGAPIIAIAHDAGRYWPMASLQKNAGEIQVFISPPFISSGTDSKAITEQIKNWIEGTIAGIKP